MGGCQHCRIGKKTSRPISSPPTQDPFQPFINPKFPKQPHVLQPELYENQAKYIPDQYIKVKVPVDQTYTKFKWVEQQTRHYPLHIIEKISAEKMRKRSFQQKMLWFRLNIEKLRVSWKQGHETLKVDRSNLVFSSLQDLHDKKLTKQLKIEFDDEKVSDAGGLLREWMHLLMKEIFDKNTGIFQLCKTEETAYKFVWDKQINYDYAERLIRLLGIVIGKALFQRVPLNCYLNRGIWRRLSGFDIFLHDAYSFDEDFYKSWRYIIDHSNIQDQKMYFSEIKIHSNGEKEQIDLVKGGKSILVDDKNKFQYIFYMYTNSYFRVQLYCYKSVKHYINVLKEGINYVVPSEYLSVFEPYEFQMLLNGPQLIDVQDWKANTIYKGYKPTDKVIKWFWEIVSQYNQEMLRNLLHYCTGSNRVPILGFKYLESNRNTSVKFSIEKVEYDKSNPYPKSYTCFNRLELPKYNNFEELEQKMLAIVTTEISFFGKE